MADSAPLRSIHVVAGVITDARGRILLTRRTEGRDLAGRWEFPGGKREPGETSEDALVRELEEELGIRAEVGDWIIDVPQRYPDKLLRLEVRRIRSFKGTPRGHEGQAMLWVMPDKLSRYDMPPADKPVVGALLQPDRYLVTPMPDAEGDAAWLASLERVLLAGIRRVQIHLPALADEHRRRLSEQAVVLCQRHGAQPLINGDLTLALRLGAGLHLPADDLMRQAQRPVEPGVCLAASCHSAEALAAAERLGCDFAVLGPVQGDERYADAPSLEWAAFEQLRESVSVPLYAIGSMCPDLIQESRRHGAQGMAEIRGRWPDAR